MATEILISYSPTNIKSEFYYVNCSLFLIFNLVVFCEFCLGVGTWER